MKSVSFGEVEYRKNSSTKRIAVSNSLYCLDFQFNNGNPSSNSPNGILCSTSENTSSYSSGYIPFNLMTSIIPNINAKSSISDFDNKFIPRPSNDEDDYELFYPYVSLCEMAGVFSNGDYNYGTGFSVSMNMILTSAHTLLRNNSIGSPCIAFKNSYMLDSYSKKYYPTDVIIPELYFNNQNSADYDWALLRFDENFGYQYGSLNLKSNYSIANNQIVSSLGYIGEDNSVQTN